MVGFLKEGAKVWWKGISWTSLSLDMRKSWNRAFLAVWLLLGVTCASLIVWNRVANVEKEKTLSMTAWCKQRSRVLEEQVKANKYSAKTFSDLFVVFGSNGTNSLTQTTFQVYSDRTNYAHPLLLDLTYAIFVDQSGRTGFETTNGFTIKDLSTGGVMSTQVDYLVTMYSNSDGQKYVSYDLMSVPDNRDAVNRMRVFGTGMMTVPYNTVQNGKIGIAVLYPVFHGTPGPHPTTSNIAAMFGAVFSLFDFETLIDKLLMQLDDPASPFLFELFDVTDITQPILIFGEQMKISRGSRGMPVAFTSYINFSKSDNPIAVDLGDPFRKYTVTCRYLKRQSGWCWGAVSWGILFMAIVILVFYIVWTTGRQVENLRSNYEKMEALKTQAEAADRAKSDFLTTVSHEIRTPMNGVLGMLEFLLDTKLDSQQLEYTKIAQASGTALISLINDVLDLAKAESGHMELEIRDFDIRKTVEEVLDVFRGKLRETGLEVAALVDEEIPAIMEGDPARLRQVLVNLMGNALKFTTQGHVLLRVCIYKENMMKVTKSGEDSSWESEKSNSCSPSSKVVTSRGSFKKQSILNNQKIHKSTLQKARKSLDRLRLSLDRQGNIPVIKNDQIVSVYDTLSGRQATDDRNSWSRINQTREISQGIFLEDGTETRSKTSFEGVGTNRPECISPSSHTLNLEGHRTSVQVCIACEDTGAGIPKEARARVFRPFVQAEKSTARIYGGTGIGLSISQQLVRLMGGKIDMTTRVGIGTTFHFVVHFGIPKQTNETTGALEKESQDSEMSSDLQGKRAILVDGIPLRRMVTEIALQRLGVIVIPVSNPKMLVDGLSALLNRSLRTTLDRKKLSSLFERWIPPLVRTSLNPSQDRLNVGRTLNGGLPDEESSSPDTPVINGFLGTTTSENVPDGHISYKSHISKRLQSLSDIRLPLSLSASPPQSIIQQNPALAENQYIEELEQGLTCDVMLVDKDAFGKGTGVELGKFLLQSKSEDGCTLTSQLPPSVLLACKLEDGEKDVQSLGFAGNLFKPIKPMIMVSLLSQVTKVVTRSLLTAGAKEKASRRRNLSNLLNGLRVMVVDDNFVNRIVASKMLQRHGVKVVTVESGQQAIDRLQTAPHAIDMVFMDVQMPGMDGFETTMKIRELEATGEIKRANSIMSTKATESRERLVVMAMTADVFSSDSEKIKGGGMDGIISKPIDEEQIYRALKRVIDFGDISPEQSPTTAHSSVASREDELTTSIRQKPATESQSEINEDFRDRVVQQQVEEPTMKTSKQQEKALGLVSDFHSEIREESSGWDDERTT